MSPLKAIRTFCLECEGGSPQGVADCLDKGCPFYLYRLGKALPKGKHTPTSAIKRYCHDYCQAGAGREEVKNCQGDTANCPAFPFRLGQNVNISPATKKKRQQAAIQRVADGSHCFLKTRHHTPVQP